MIDFIIFCIIFLGPLAFFYAIGRFVDKKQYKSIIERENKYKDILILNEKRIQPNTDVNQLERNSYYLVSGSVVVSGGYFRQVIAGLKSIFGGRLRSYEFVMEIGRREAILRMKESVIKYNAKLIYNVKFETTMLNQKQGKQGLACAEFVAYGTAVV